MTIGVRGPALSALLGLAALGVSETAAGQGAVRVEVRGEAGSYALYRGGAPYLVRGAGAQSLGDLESLARHGGNSVRNWAVGDGSILDRARELGLTVGLCLNLARERHGFDYGDPRAVAAQFERVRAQVLAHRDHPALLFWMIGNELNFDYRNPAVYDAVNDISKMIHAHDPNHPTTTATAGIDASLAQVILERAPDLDFLSVQLYGGLLGLAETLERLDLDMPVMVTEWGTVGHWEVARTPWGAPIEPTSSAKARRYLEGYKRVLRRMEGRLIGHYAFLWGQKQERTPTWYGVFTADGRRTETVDVLQGIWTGAWPANRAPRLLSLRLDGKAAADGVRLVAGREYVAAVRAVDVEGDRLRFEWSVMRESTATQSGGDAEQVPEAIDLPDVDPFADEITLRAPRRRGPYRLFVYAGDGHGAAAHANVPFEVVGR